MKKILLIITLVTILFSLGYSQYLYLREENNKYGYVDSLGTVAIPFIYDFAFTDTMINIAFVAHNGEIKAINKNNNILFTVFNYDNGPDYLHEGLFRIKDDEDNIGFGNMEGNIIIKPAYFYATPFQYGFSAVNKGGYLENTDHLNNYSVVSGGKWGLINKNGKKVLPVIFDKISFLNDEKLLIQFGNYNFYIDLKNR